MLFAFCFVVCLSQVWSNYLALSVESAACYLFVFCRSGAIVRPCQWSRVIVMCLYFADSEQLFDLVSGVRWLSFVCILEVWSNYLILSVESGDCYFLVYCSSGAIVRPSQWSLVIALCLYVASVEQLLDHVRGFW